jgi:short-subunit dehydrogenase
MKEIDTVIITGASRGSGAEIALGLATAPRHLVLAARDATKLDTVGRACAARGARVTVVAGDITRADEREHLIRTAGATDVLINNAGVETTTALADHAREQVERQINGAREVLVTPRPVRPLLVLRAMLPDARDRCSNGSA